MTPELGAQMKRRDIMLKVNGVALFIAVIALIAKFKYQVWWALYLFVAILLVGFATQVWFVYGLTSKSPRKPRAGKGA